VSLRWTTLDHPIPCSKEPEKTAAKRCFAAELRQALVLFRYQAPDGGAGYHHDRVLRELEVFQERHPNFFTD